MKKIVCDACESEIRDFKYKNIDYTFGYGSPHDGDLIDIDLCEDCLLKFFQNLSYLQKL